MTLWINGDWVTGQGALRVKRNPVSGEVLWQGNDADAAQVGQACRAARAAFPRWARLSFAERQAVVERFAALLESNKAELTAIIARETGKPRWEAATEVTAMINKIAISIKAYHVRTGEQRSEMPDGAASLRHRPHGVLAVFGPYNFPGHLPNGHIVPALLAGNTIIFKPSELTPWSGEAVMRLWQQAGLPPGVLNLVQGGRETGQALSALEDLDGLLFTGSANTGYQLHRQLSGQPEKILALEMGGNNPLIIDDVADIDAAVHLTIQSAFVTAGQRCTCARRLLLKSGAQGDAFLARLVAVSQRLTPGNWDDEPQPFIGGLISEQAAQQVVTAWQQLEAMGGRTLLAPRLLQAGTSLLTPGLIEMTGVAAYQMKRCSDRYCASGVMILSMKRFEWRITLASDSLADWFPPSGKNSINCCWRRGRGLLTGTNRLPALPVPRHSAALALPVTIAPAPGMPQIIVPGRWRAWSRTR